MERYSVSGRLVGATMEKSDVTLLFVEDFQIFCVKKFSSEIFFRQIEENFPSRGGICPPFPPWLRAFRSAKIIAGIYRFARV